MHPVPEELKNEIPPVRLKEIRRAHRLTQAEVSTALRMSREVYGRYERGKREIPASLVVKLAMLYGCSTDELLGL